MDIYRNFNIAHTNKYELQFDSSEQKVISEAYSWGIAKLVDMGFEEEDVHKSLTDDFVVMSLVQEEGFAKSYRTFADSENIAELQDVLIAHQKEVTLSDRPVISSDRRKHNKDFPNQKSGMLASDISNKLAFIEMNSRDCELRHFRAPIAPFVATA